MIITFFSLLSFTSIPRIPFQVYDPEYRKTIFVVASCKKDNNSTILEFDHKDKKIDKLVLRTVNKAFDKPGITKVKICRKDIKNEQN
jgi:hypothetical protein